MSAKTLWGTLSGALAAVGLALAHNIDAIISRPAIAVSIILTALSGWLFGHHAGTKAALPPVSPAKRNNS